MACGISKLGVSTLMTPQGGLQEADHNLEFFGYKNNIQL